MASSFFVPLTTQTILEGLIVILTSWLFLKFSHAFLAQAAHRLSSKRRLTVLALIPTIRLLTIIITVILLFPIYINTSRESLLAIFGAAGIALGFGLQGFTSNLIAGIMAVYERPFKPGDWIEINGIYGEVVFLGLKNIDIKTSDDTIVKIPTGLLWTTPVFNSSSGQREILCVTNFYLHPDHNPVSVKAALYDAVISNHLLQSNKPISIVVVEKPGYTHYKVKAYPMDARDQFQFTTDTTIRSKILLESLNIKYIEFPSFKI